MPLTSLASLALCASTAYPAQTDWSGWARCELRITGAGYTNTETHTWMISHVKGGTPAMGGEATWSVAGSGSHFLSDSVTSERAEWSISGNASGGRFIAEVTAGVLRIRPVHAQLRQSNGIVGYAQQTISGSVRTPVPINSTAFEWGFPPVQVPVGNQTIVGNSTTAPSAPWGIRQPSPSTMTAQCNWSFANGSVPTPPSVVVAPPPPVPPGTPPSTVPTAAEKRWKGWIECQVTASGVPGYQETQVHRWELAGNQPTASAGAYVHAANWKVKGKGSWRNRVETTQWTTQGKGKTSLSMSIRASDGKLVIAPAQQPSIAVGGLQGTRQPNRPGTPATPVAFDIGEYPLPPVAADPLRKRFKEKNSTALTARLSRLQPAGATGTSSCRWELDSMAP